MTQENFEAQFLDYIEERLSPEETERLRAELSRNSELRASFEDYSRIVEAERMIAGEAHSLHPNFSVKVMDNLDAHSEQGFIRRLVMYFTENRKLIYSSVATCATLVVVLSVTYRPLPDKVDFELTQERLKSVLVDVERSKPASAVAGREAAAPVIAKELKDGSDVGMLSKSKAGEALEELSRSLDARKVDQAAQPQPVVPNQLAGSGRPDSDKSYEKNREAYSDLIAGSSESIAQGSGVESHSIKRDDEMYQDRSSKIFKKMLERMESKGARNQDFGSTVNAQKLSESLHDKMEPYSTEMEADAKEYSRSRVGQGIANPLSPAAAPPASRDSAFKARNELSQSIVSNESYISVSENKRTLVQDEAVSTFSIDVDTASYTNVRRYISSGQLPPADAVRVEEFINYFDYNYPVQYEKPFTLSYEIAPSPLEKEKFLLKLGVKARDAQPNTKGWNLVLLVDVSGSMSDSNKLPLLKRSLPVLVDQMRSQDKIAIVTYAGSAGVALESTNGSEKFRIQNAIENLSSGGSTNGAGGIHAAYEIAQRNKIEGGVNRVILMTDGDFNVGVTSHDDLIRLIEDKRRSGITLTTIGVGQGNLKDGVIEQLANKGNGNYFYLDSFKEARKVLQTDLVGNMEVVAKDVKLQIEFNPQHVAEYRLVGYDNRRLKKQDFNNDAIDAGEIGTGHTVTALYEVVLANTEAAKRLQEDLRYQKAERKLIEVPEDKRAELAFLKIRYKKPDEDRSNLLEYPIATADVRKDSAQTTEDFRFAAAVSYFGALLRKSEFAGSYSFSDIASLAQSAKGSDQKGYRQEFIELVKDAQALSKGSESSGAVRQIE